MTYRTPVAQVTLLDGARLAQRWAPEMRALCAQHAATLNTHTFPAPPVLDMTRGIDIVAVTRVVPYAARIRNAYYRHRYPDDVTIRAVVPSGAPTELDKFLAGTIAAEWYLYAFVADDETHIDAWTFIDIAALSAYLQSQGRAALTDAVQMNGDGTGLVAINVTDLPAGSFTRHGSLPAPLF